MFIESPRFPTDLSFQKPGGPGFSVDVQVLESGHEQRNQFWPESRRELDIGYGIREQYKVAALFDYFESLGGMEHGFRLRDNRAYKSVQITSASPQGDTKDPISALDQVISVDATTTDVFQLIYTSYFGPFARHHAITKPEIKEDGTYNVLLAIQGITIPITRYDLLSVPEKWAREGHETVGIITLAANITKAISGITNATSAVVETATAHGLSVNDSVHFSSVSGMTGINGKRGLITAIGDTTHFTVAIDSTGLGTYTSGGTINTRRQSLASTVSIAAITKGPLATVTTTGAHGLIAGDVGVFASVGGMTQLNGLTANVRQVISTTKFRINLSTFDFSAYTSGGTFAVAERVTAGYVYDLAARLNTNNFPMQFEAWEASGVSLPAVELRLV